MKTIGLLGNSEMRPLLKRYAQFCLVGGTGVIVDMAVLWLLASPLALGWNLSLSKVIAAESAIFNNFFWNDRWTFRVETARRNTPRQRLIRFLKFNLICASGIGLSVLLLNVQVHGLGVNLYLSNFIAIVLVSLWNFLLNVKFGWNSTSVD
jgi:dolichol-phosphate mannosyltransferase